MTDWLGLGGARCLVLGGGGIGAACVAALTQAGAHVLLVDLDQERLEKIQAATAGHSGHVTTLVADLSTASACRGAVTAAATALGGLDVFVHAIGHNERTPVVDLTDDQWDQVLGLNLSTAFWAGQAVGKVMLAQGSGRLIFLSSVSGLLAHRHHGPYAASKGGLNQLVRVMAREWAGDGITVNAVAPGYTRTQLTADYLARPGMLDEMTALVPAGRLGTTDDLTGPVLFLASRQSSFITGQVLFVDGGRTLV
jgi:NAD(P)-dependent dehydrogenase (short-subunit alcohol dehydrogenase family)